MPHPTRRLGATLPLARSVAISAFIAAHVAILAPAAQSAEPTGAARAQPTKPTPAATNPTGDKQVEQRITQLHSELKITPDQEAQWNAVAQAMRDNAASMQKLIAQKQQQGPQNVTAVDDLENHQQFIQAQLDGMKNFTSAFKTLYDSMSDQQKKNADQIFAKIDRTPSQGGAPRNG